MLYYPRVGREGGIVETTDYVGVCGHRSESLICEQINLHI